MAPFHVFSPAERTLVQSRRWIGMLGAAALVALVAGDAHATLIGQSVSVALTDGGSLDASDVVVVGAGAEIGPGVTERHERDMRPSGRDEPPLRIFLPRRASPV